MPAGDGTGPRGEGTRTGRGAGYCSGFTQPGFAVGPGRGFGMGWGAGPGSGRRGWGRGYGLRGAGRGWGQAGFGPGYGCHTAMGPAAVPAPEEQKQALRQQADWLKGQLDAIETRLSDLDKDE